MFQIILADHYGVCFGVRDAITQAEALALRTPLTILGELVHNPVVRDRLADLGASEAPLAEIGRAGTAQVMITAHGASDTQRDAWKSAGFEVADGTCPLVRRAHDSLRELVAQAFTPVVIGQHGHAEVLGLIGDFPGATVVQDEADFALLPPAERYGVVSQTTQPTDRVRSLVAKLRLARPASEIRFCDTVCQPTKNRQLALHKLLTQVDTMVVVGGRGSNNTRQLVTSSRAVGCRAFHVERPEELQPEWFATSRIVGLTAGTSTLRETVAAVRAQLEAIATLFPAKAA